MRRGIAGLVSVAMFGTVAVGVASLGVASPAAGAVSGASRLDGNDRFATAIAVSQAEFKAATDKGGVNAHAVVLSRADQFADALAGTPLAVVKVGPTLLTNSDSLEPRTETEIQRVLPSGDTVYLLGGTAAISDAVAARLTSDGYTVARIAGADRFETAVKVAQAVGTPKTILLATGTDPGDALAAGTAAAATGGVVVLTDGSTMPSATATYLQSNANVPVVAVGGAAAAADPSAVALVGTDRFDTSVKVAEHFFTNPAAIGFANGFAFPDALSGGPFVAKLGGPMMLVDYTNLPQTIHDYVVSVHSGLQSAEIFGGPSVISGGEGQTNGGEEAAIDGALQGK